MGRLSSRAINVHVSSWVEAEEDCALLETNAQRSRAFNAYVVFLFLLEKICGEKETFTCGIVTYEQPAGGPPTHRATGHWPVCLVHVLSAPRLSSGETCACSRREW